MAVSDWSATPSQNTSIDGINIGEGCPPANINNAIRSVMASVKVAFQGLPSTANFVAKTGGVFTGNPTYTGRGGYLHFNDASMTSGRVFVQAAGGGAPAMSNGDILIEY